MTTLGDLKPGDRAWIEGTVDDAGWPFVEIAGSLCALPSDTPVRDVTPAPVPEPIGLGAVVRDARGRCWMRFATTGDMPWMSPSTRGYDAAGWTGLAHPVEVLSPGVEP